MQCEQTKHGVGCTTQGICGKMPETANRQDFLIENNKTVGYLAELMVSKNLEVPDYIRRGLLESTFATLTNVNFSEERFNVQIEDSNRHIEEMLQALNMTRDQVPARFLLEKDLSRLEDLVAKTGVLARSSKVDPDVFSMIELNMYGLKGIVAYFDHAELIREADNSVYSKAEADAIQKGIQKLFADLAETQNDLAGMLKITDDAGALTVQVLEILDRANRNYLGNPTPTKVSGVPVDGKCILVSGHDLFLMKSILEQSEGKGINVYTHGELLPAHSQPELQKYKHLKGH